MKTVLSYVICYPLWVMSAALAFFELLMVTRGLILRISTVTIERPYSNPMMTVPVMSSPPSTTDATTFSA